MLVRQLVQHLTDTAPGGADVFVRVAGPDGVVEMPIAHAHVEPREGRLDPVVVVYLKPS